MTTTGDDSKRGVYAPRGEEKRITVSVVLAPHVYDYCRSRASRTGYSVSRVMSDLLERGIEAASRGKAKGVAP